MSAANPLLAKYRAARQHMLTRHPDAARFWRGQPDYWGCIECRDYEDRDKSIRSVYSWAIPDDGALEMIARYSPRGVVEIGAGTGYWAMLLSARGVDVVAYDEHPPPSTDNGYHKGREPFYAVEQGGPLDAKAHPERTLFLCWPVMSSMAYESVQAYGGDTVVYVGEGPGGCTADDAFFALMGDQEECWSCESGKPEECWRSPNCDQLPRPMWEEIDAHQIPQWSGLHDSLMVYRRKP